MVNNIVGVDIGTMFINASKQADDDRVQVSTIRNMYLPLKPENTSTKKMRDAGVNFIEKFDDNKNLESIYVISEDAMTFSMVGNVEVKRPMQNGVINRDMDAMDVLTMMCEKLVGKTTNGYCVYSVPAQAIDAIIPPVEYHAEVFRRIFSSLGYESKPLNEALSVIYSECSDTNFSGIGISFGCGLSNIAFNYKNLISVQFSISRGGDWIDTHAANSLGIPRANVTTIKENKLKLSGPIEGNKIERRVCEALRLYYKNLIEYTIVAFIEEFKKRVGANVIDPIPIVISGGTSKPEGFIDMFREIFSKYAEDFPLSISEIRHAKDPLYAVSNGCLIYAVTYKTE